MKVIELLNKIANGEVDYEQQIKIDNEIINVSTLLGTYVFSKERFNDEVEIIEEDKKIRKICTFPGLDDDDYAYEDGNRPNNVKINNMMEQLLINKINEIINKLNEE